MLWLEAVNLGADASSEIVVLLADSDVESWDQARRTLQGDFATIANPTAMRVHDADAGAAARAPTGLAASPVGVSGLAVRDRA
ncbi:MAG: hypothetical protein HZA52_12200 [Planctomycetes bacterium]|nr:hypothetical protein [Planctomycetota bacterium]